MRIFYFALLGLFCHAASLSAAVIESEGPIHSVTVFQDRAQVTRVAVVNAEAGRHTVVFPNLPGQLEPNSITARAKGDVPVSLFGAKIVTRETEKSQPPRVKEIEARLHVIQDELTSVQNVRRLLQTRQKFLESIQAASRDQIGEDLVTRQPAMQDVQGLLQLMDTEFMATFEQEREQARLARDLQEERGKLQRELASLRGSGQKRRSAIHVDVELSAKGSIEVAATYRLAGATWEPVYEARASLTEKKVELRMFGLVRQRTGEDWTNVELNLSTAKPSVSGQVPEIFTRYLRKVEPMPQPKPMRRQRAMLMEMKSEMILADAAAPMPMAAKAKDFDAAPVQATVSSKGPSVHYKLPSAESVPADWQPAKLAIGSFDAPAVFKHQAVPRLAPHAYLTARITNPAEGVLLRGKMQIFVDGAFVGSSLMKVTGSGESFDLSLGTDERVKVEHRRLAAKEDMSILAGFHGKVKSIEYEYMTTLENHTGASIVLEVIDQVPVSEHDEIKVEKVEFDPAPTRQDEEKPGVQIWELQLAAGQKQELRSSYRVKHPVDFMVAGL